MYAPNEELARRNLWSELVEKMSGRDIMWCLGGDFNTVRNEQEKTRRAEIERTARDFGDFIEGLAL